MQGFDDEVHEPISDQSTSWTPILEQYSIDEVLHVDNGMCLAKATNYQTKAKVHIKFVNNLRKDRNKTVMLLRELLILHELTIMPDNIFTVKLVNIILPKIEGSTLGPREINQLFFVYEDQVMNLKSLQQNNSPGQFTETHLLCLTYNLLCCLNFLESAGIMHRNLQP